MHEAALYEQLGNGRVRCGLCPRHCNIQPGGRGYCQAYRNDGGTLISVDYGQVSSAAVDPIEKKPLFHFYPGSRVFSLGSWGCNMRCRHCQNWEIACVDVGEDGEGREMSPEDAVRTAKRHGSQGIAWTYNEPSMWLEYTVDTAMRARAEGLYTVYVTNGYLSLEALDLIGPYLDAWRVDFKGFTDAFYRDLARVPDFRPILDATLRAKERWGCHVEVVTNIIPTRNDDTAQLEALAAWVAQHLGRQTPWHVTRFYPHRDLLDVPPTPLSTLERARQIGLDAGLQYVYLGNVPGHEAEHTYCPSCGERVIVRAGYHVQLVGVREGLCRSCGASLNIRGG